MYCRLVTGSLHSKSPVSVEVEEHVQHLVIFLSIQLANKIFKSRENIFVLCEWALCLNVTLTCALSAIILYAFALHLPWKLLTESHPMKLWREWNMQSISLLSPRTTSRCREDSAGSTRPSASSHGGLLALMSAKYCWMCRAYVWALPLPSLIAADSPSNLCLITAMSFRRAANSDMILVSIAVRTSPTGWGLAWRGRVCWCGVLGPYCCTTHRWYRGIPVVWLVNQRRVGRLVLAGVPWSWSGVWGQEAAKARQIRVSHLELVFVSKEGGAQVLLLTIIYKI